MNELATRKTPPSERTSYAIIKISQNDLFGSARCVSDRRTTPVAARTVHDVVSPPRPARSSSSFYRSPLSSPRAHNTTGCRGKGVFIMRTRRLSEAPVAHPTPNKTIFAVLNKHAYSRMFEAMTTTVQTVTLTFFVCLFRVYENIEHN